MTKPIITIENLGKQYRRGADGSVPYKAFRDILTHPIKSYKERKKVKANPYFWVFKDLNLTINEGDVVGIIGRNGAGKSTLLKLLSEVTSPTEGSITLKGRVGSLLEVGTGFHPELTGRENVYMNGAILGMSKSEINAKFDQIVEFAGVGDFIDTPIKRYSSGMKTRLAFSVAAHLDPEILIIDEVLAVGDQAFQKKCLGKMQDVAGQGRTVLFVSHNMSTIRQLCNRVIFIDEGVVKSDSYDIEIPIQDYLVNNNENSYQWIGDNKFNDPLFLPKKFFITDDKGKILKGGAAADKDLTVNINFELKDNVNHLAVGYGIYDGSGNLLYMTYSSDYMDAVPQNLKSGDYSLSSNIPANILNEGEYNLVMIAGVYRDRPILKIGTSPISIKLEIIPHKDRSNFWSERRGSILAPNIKWSIKSI